jgi:EAL domain-containing protein (putative c-di-GMP-specific phosphodiesterase class I)
MNTQPTAEMSPSNQPEEAAGSSFHWHLEGSLDGNSGLTLVRLMRSPFVVGRAIDCDCVIPSQNVSKRHAEIIIAGDAVFVRDCGSTNGTFVNGIRAASPTPVGEGDLIQFADVELRLGCMVAMPNVNTNVNESLTDGWLISRFRALLDDEQLTMHYQPIVTAHDMNSMGVEALVRCDLSDMEKPQQLFHAAARLGLESRVSRLCRKKAVEEMLRSNCRDDLFLNTHPHEQLGRELVDELAALRLISGTRRIVLELHEAAVPDTQSIADFRDALKDIGVELAYDDFGAGQSRLVELAKVPPDYVKFDQSLVNDLGRATGTQFALLETLVKLAGEAGIATVAEGLEDQESVRICRQLGFTHLQGFAISRPMPVEKLTDTWTANRTR